MPPPDSLPDMTVKRLVGSAVRRLRQNRAWSGFETLLDQTGITRTRAYRELLDERNRLNHELEHIRQQNAEAPQFMPPGHFYSAIPKLSELRAREERIFSATREIKGIDLNEKQQLELLHSFKKFYDELPFPTARTPGQRYWFENPAYSYSDAIFLHCMIRHARPKRIIEVGSGYSSAATLDTNDHFFGGNIRCSFIEPYPELLKSLLKPGDLERIELLERPLQDVPLEMFSTLEANDILFIDSTHVSRAGSDVNYIFFDILPSLKPGVFIHFHDIFYPFEYPKPWVYEGRQWTEAYLLRAFLMFNSAFRIVAFNTFLEYAHERFFKLNMPMCLQNRGGSIWLQKI